MSNNRKKQNVIFFLKENYEQLTESQKIIGKYLLDHIRGIPFLSAAELGERVGFSDATIIRFARSVGYEGYSDLKNSIIAMNQKMASPDERVLKNLADLDSLDDLGLRVAELDLKNLQDFLIGINMKRIESAVELIYNSKTIYFIGLQDSALVVDFLLLHMRRMGFDVMSITEGGLENIEKLGAVKAGDLLIACSFPRYSKTTFNAILFAKRKGARVISFTDSELSIIGVKSDIAFDIKTDNSGFFNSHIVTLELCNILLIKLLEKNKDFVYKNLKEIIEGFELFDMYM
jgi:DNA-binding MurR/RpiR family transcriptional regulator